MFPLNVPREGDNLVEGGWGQAASVLAGSGGFGTVGGGLQLGLSPVMLKTLSETFIFDLKLN